MVDAVELSLPAVLTQAQAPAVTQALLQALQGRSQARVVLDVSALAEFDSAALAVILACRRAVMAAGGQLLLQGVPSRVQTLAQAYGVAELLI